MTTEAETVSQSPGCGCSRSVLISCIVAFMIWTMIFSMAMGWTFAGISVIAFFFSIMALVLIAYGCVKYMSQERLESDVPRDGEMYQQNIHIPMVSVNLASSERDPPPDYETVKPIEYGWKSEIGTEVPPYS